MKKILVILSLFTLVFLSSCSNYSSGYRTGQLIKFSNKGAIFKTWEGEMNLGGLREESNSKGNISMVANTWDFSIDQGAHRGENIQALSDTLNVALEEGYRIRVHYNQELLTNLTNSRGSTGYFVDKVEIIRK